MSAIGRSLLMLLRLSVLYVITACVSIFAPDLFLLRHASTIVLMVYSLALMLYFSNHIIEPELRRHLVAIAALIVQWVTLRGAKYIAFEETGLIARHLWYLYYVPALLVPLLSLIAAISFGRQDEWVLPKAVLPLVFVTILLLFLILTNDAHELAFRFRPGFENWDADYAHGPVFTLTYIWVSLLSIAMFAVLFARCRLSGSRRLAWIPMLPAVFGVSYLTLYAADLWPKINGGLFGEFPEAVCFTIAGIWLSIIEIGLIPSNTDYGRLFSLSSLAAQIADRGYHVVYRSENAAPLSEEQMASLTGVSPDENTRVHRRPVSGGFVYWQDDITALNRINEDLRELSERLADENQLLRLRNELTEERARIETKTRTYDAIAARVLPQSEKITRLCTEAGQDPSLYARNLKTVCLLASYIKRYANLTLLAADARTLEAKELALALQESLRHLRALSIATDAAYEDDRRYPAGTLISAYALFETLLESALPTLSGLQVLLEGGTLRLAFEGSVLSLPADTRAEALTEDQTTYVVIPLEKAGDAA